MKDVEAYTVKKFVTRVEISQEDANHPTKNWEMALNGMKRLLEV